MWIRALEAKPSLPVFKKFLKTTDLLPHPMVVGEKQAIAKAAIAKCFDKKMEVKNKHAYENEKATFESDSIEINGYINGYVNRKLNALGSGRDLAYSHIIKIYGYRSWNVATKNGETEKKYAAFLDAAQGKT